VQVPKPLHDSAVDIVQLNSNGKVDANGGEASQSALPFSQLYMTFEHGTLIVLHMLMLSKMALLMVHLAHVVSHMVWMQAVCCCALRLVDSVGIARACKPGVSYWHHEVRHGSDGGSWPAVYYSVDLPAGADEPANQRPEDAGRLSILNDVSGAFRPNILTAFMGETGAGKTTLLDVLADRKTGGKIEGDIRINVRLVRHARSCQLVSAYRALAASQHTCVLCGLRPMVGACRVTPRLQPHSPASVATWSRRTFTRLRFGFGSA